MVKSSGEFNEISHKNQKLCRNLSGEERERVAQTLQSISASYYRDKEINSICNDPLKLARYKDGDLQSAIPSATLSVAKSQFKSKDDFEIDAILDLFACFEKNLLSSLSFPLKFEIIKDEYMDVLKCSKRSSFDRTLYLDATGSLIEKSIFY